jgi:hypothetical protein
MASLGACVKKGKYNASRIAFGIGFLFTFPRKDHMPFFIKLYRHVEGMDICVVKKSDIF